MIIHTKLSHPKSLDNSVTSSRSVFDFAEMMCELVSRGPDISITAFLEVGKLIDFTSKREVAVLELGRKPILSHNTGMDESEVQS